jgi:hypothetical protein
MVAILGVTALACASMPTSPSLNHQGEVVLAPGQSVPVPETSLTLHFEGVAEDSRCPTGVTCVWEGDAIVRIRIEAPGTAASQYTLHTSQRFPQQIVHGSVRVRLVSVSPYPAADRPIRADAYRVTLALERA